MESGEVATTAGQPKGGKAGTRANKKQKLLTARTSGEEVLA